MINTSLPHRLNQIKNHKIKTFINNELNWILNDNKNYK